MNDSHNNQNHPNPSQNLQVWYCGHCQAVHFKTGNVMLNFTRPEFAELTRSVVEIYSQEIGAMEIFDLINAAAEREDNILSSGTIA